MTASGISDWKVTKIMGLYFPAFLLLMLFPNLTLEQSTFISSRTQNKQPSFSPISKYSSLWISHFAPHKNELICSTNFSIL